ncbi:MAG: V-type ATP synthase subunit D [bacterium]
MRIQVNPTRMEVLNLRRRLALARRGHKLLKDKQDELMRRFMIFLDHNKELRKKVDEELKKIFNLYLGVCSRTNKESLYSAIKYPQEVPEFLSSKLTVLNIKAPHIEISKPGNPFSYGFKDTSPDMDIALSMLSALLPEMLKLAEIEKLIHLVADEIKKTRRRVNALEYILIPNLEETITYITMKLSELELANIVRLMKIKDIARAK